MIYFITVSPGKSLCVCALKEKEDEEGGAAAAQDESVSPAHWISIEGGSKKGREGRRREPLLCYLWSRRARNRLCSLSHSPLPTMATRNDNDNFDAGAMLYDDGAAERLSSARVESLS